MVKVWVFTGYHGDNGSITVCLVSLLAGREGERERETGEKLKVISDRCDDKMRSHYMWQYGSPYLLPPHYGLTLAQKASLAYGRANN